MAHEACGQQAEVKTGRLQIWSRGINLGDELSIVLIQPIYGTLCTLDGSGRLHSVGTAHFVECYYFSRHAWSRVAVLQHLRQFETADLSSGLRLGWSLKIELANPEYHNPHYPPILWRSPANLLWGISIVSGKRKKCRDRLCWGGDTVKQCVKEPILAGYPVEEYLSRSQVEKHKLHFQVPQKWSVTTMANPSSTELNLKQEKNQFIHIRSHHLHTLWASTPVSPSQEHPQASAQLSPSALPVLQTQTHLRPQTPAQLCSQDRTHPSAVQKSTAGCSGWVRRWSRLLQSMSQVGVGVHRHSTKSLESIAYFGFDKTH